MDVERVARLFRMDDEAWRRHANAPDHRSVLRILVALGSVGFALVARGLVVLSVWPTVFGATLVVVAQLWCIDRFGRLRERVNAA